MSRAFLVIPARLASTRLPRKLLLRETGQSLLAHTYAAARRARRPAGMCVAADCEEIAAEVRSFGGEVVLTSPACPSGTDRVAEVARARPEFDIFVNVQGDEPELAGSSIDLVVELLLADPAAQVATLATPIRSRTQWQDPACVKAVFTTYEQLARGGQWPGPLPQLPGAPRAGRALYFSRSPVPHARNWDDRLLTADPPAFHQHVGLYAYRRDFLLRVAQLSRTPLEQLENLEQLRVLESGHAIAIGVIDEPTVGIDTPEDYRAFVARMRGR